MKDILFCCENAELLDLVFTKSGRFLTCVRQRIHVDKQAFTTTPECLL